MRETRLLLLFAFAITLAGIGCDGGGDGGDGPGDDDDDDGVSGVAHVIQGATAPAPFQLTGGGLPSDGIWDVSPDQVQVTITRVNLKAANDAESTGFDLTGCTVTYDRANQSGDSLLDCPFTVQAGTYVSMNVFTDPVVQILINDAGNNIYTDPASGTGLTSTAPAGGAALVPVTASLGGGLEQFFTTPLVVGSGGSALSLSLVVDAVQTSEITVSGGGTVLEFGDYFPARIFPTIGSPGVPQYYTSANTADSYNGDLLLAHKVRVYFAGGAGSQPIVASFDQLAGQINACQAGAGGLVYPADPATTPASSTGDRAGGWLAVDPANTICGALAEGGVPNYTQYHSYFTMPKVETVGNTTLLTCELTSTPTPPTSGTTYASGCPGFAAVLGSANLMLVAD